MLDPVTTPDAWAAQREFFNPRTCRPDTVTRAKALERQVDRMLDDLLPGRQGTLFGGE